MTGNGSALGYSSGEIKAITSIDEDLKAGDSLLVQIDGEHRDFTVTQFLGEGVVGRVYAVQNGVSQGVLKLLKSEGYQSQFDQELKVANDIAENYPATESFLAGGREVEVSLAESPTISRPALFKPKLIALEDMFLAGKHPYFRQRGTSHNRSVLVDPLIAVEIFQDQIQGYVRASAGLIHPDLGRLQNIGLNTFIDHDLIKKFWSVITVSGQKIEDSDPVTSSYLFQQFWENELFDNRDRVKQKYNYLFEDILEKKEIKSLTKATIPDEYKIFFNMGIEVGGSYRANSKPKQEVIVPELYAVSSRIFRKFIANWDPKVGGINIMENQIVENLVLDLLVSLGNRHDKDFQGKVGNTYTSQNISSIIEYAVTELLDKYPDLDKSYLHESLRFLANLIHREVGNYEDIRIRQYLRTAQVPIVDHREQSRKFLTELRANKDLYYQDYQQFVKQFQNLNGAIDLLDMALDKKNGSPKKLSHAQTEFFKKYKGRNSLDGFITKLCNYIDKVKIQIIEMSDKIDGFDNKQVASTGVKSSQKNYFRFDSEIMGQVVQDIFSHYNQSPINKLRATGFSYAQIEEKIKIPACQRMAYNLELYAKNDDLFEKKDQQSYKAKTLFLYLMGQSEKVDNSQFDQDIKSLLQDFGLVIKGNRFSVNMIIQNLNKVLKIFKTEEIPAELMGCFKQRLVIRTLLEAHIIKKEKDKLFFNSRINQLQRTKLTQKFGLSKLISINPLSDQYFTAVRYLGQRWNGQAINKAYKYNLEWLMTKLLGADDRTDVAYFERGKNMDIRDKVKVFKVIHTKQLELMESCLDPKTQDEYRQKIVYPKLKKLLCEQIDQITPQITTEEEYEGEAEYYYDEDGEIYYDEI